MIFWSRIAAGMIGSVEKKVFEKSSVEEIRDRFDRDVERFSNLETGQTATVDAALALELVARSAARTTPAARAMLDIGCGAGNFTLKVLERLPNLDCTLIDLSPNMLARANVRVSTATAGLVSTIQQDIRLVEMPPNSVDVAVAAAVLHHLRDENEWRETFRKIFRWLRPGGSLWIFDFVSHEVEAVQDIMWNRYGDYLAAFKGEEYREQVFAYVDREDSPRSVLFQCELLREAGFREIDILHKNSCFAAFGARKA
jgi:tRNA (cmo5U34)-methyltransferase